ncbi:myosin heavy chain, embryonic smooth muscle isoform-like isoform X3 [Oncorhynchus masou masou]|uniref:myosin heavy chain, embryonic smooth muscle isoform-like isoform X3 n=1 Tax=Oncorhynchus masou masou TaxID=90313 RepID=UPI003183D7B3
MYELFYELYCDISINEMTRQDQMRQLYQALEEAKDSRRVKLDFYRILLDLESNLVRDLDSSEEVHYLYDLQNLTGQLEEVRKENDSNEEERYLYDLQNLSRQLEEVRIENDDLQNLSRQLEEVKGERDELKGELKEVKGERDELKEELRKARETIQSLSTSPGGQQETQTPSQKSKRIEGMEMKSLPGSGSLPEKRPLLGPGPQNDDLDEMERGGRVTIDNNSML